MDAPYGLILAGGRGNRFWPRSRRASAKQVLTFFGERSLIQQTVDRLRPVIAPERIWILTNQHLRDTIVKQLPEVPARQILSEPAPGAQHRSCNRSGGAHFRIDRTGRGDGRISGGPCDREAARVPAAAEAGDSRGSSRQDRGGLENQPALGRNRVRLHRIPARGAGRLV